MKTDECCFQTRQERYGQCSRPASVVPHKEKHSHGKPNFINKYKNTDVQIQSEYKIAVVLHKMDKVW